MENAVHASANEQAASKEAALVFGSFAVGVQSTYEQYFFLCWLFCFCCLIVRNSTDSCSCSFAWIKPSVVAKGNIDSVINRIKAESFEILEISKLQLNRKQVETFYAKQVDEPHFEDLVNEMTCGPAVALWLRKDSAIKLWQELCGPTDPEKAKMTNPRRYF